MKSLALIVIFCLSTVAAGVAKEPFHSESDDYLIDLINSKQSQWRAGRNFGPNFTWAQFRRLLGVNKEMAKRRGPVKRVHHIKDTEIPKSFDAREIWPDCDNIKVIFDQSDCGSCYAIAPATAMSDRICIATSMKSQVDVSVANIIECCAECGFGCDGGEPIRSWEYWAENGVVTGGPYNSNLGCQNYPFPSCRTEDDPVDSRPECPMFGYDAPACTSMCDNDTVPYDGSFTYGTEAYVLEQDAEQIQLEIMKNGPVSADYAVYQDFRDYKSGVYEHTEGWLAGYHSVRVIGWGVENEEIKYWLVTNSWGTDWGDQGLFKILRGVNECGFEEAVAAGIPKL